MTISYSSKKMWLLLLSVSISYASSNNVTWIHLPTQSDVCSSPTTTYIIWPYVRSAVNRMFEFPTFPQSTQADSIPVSRCRLGRCFRNSFCAPKNKETKKIKMCIIDKQQGKQQELEIHYKVDRICHCTNFNKYDKEVNDKRSLLLYVNITNTEDCGDVNSGVIDMAGVNSSVIDMAGVNSSVIDMAGVVNYFLLFFLCLYNL